MTDSRRPAPRHESESSPVLTAGGVVVQMFDDVPYTAIVHRPKFNDWSIPKGKVDPGETLEQTALREIREETALECTLGEYLGTQYFPDGDKLGHYWLMHVSIDHGFTPDAEIDGLRWVPLHEATEAVDQEQDRRLITEALARLHARS